jgi:Restriction endonuclease XhoI
VNQEAFEAAVRTYWDTRTKQHRRQQELGKVDAGLRGAVTGGAHMNAIAAVTEQIFVDAGFPITSIQRKAVELPGYFRPTKKWDLVVVHHGELVAAIEFKSHVGPSFGNNYNNRIEEAIGSASDLRIAAEHGMFGPRKPWLGYFLLLEEALRSTAPVRVRSPYFSADRAYDGASYKGRYEAFCRRLLTSGLYDAVCFATSSAAPGSPIHEPSDLLSFRAFTDAISSYAENVLSELR